MRPLRLDIEGFSTFRDRLEIDFGDVDLIAFVGPTGSGKSSIIDAITFALFGSVSRYDDVRLVAPVITQGANEAKVRLDFELDGSRYTAIRVVRRTKTGATTKEARLEKLSGSGGELEFSPVMASGAKELTTAVEELLGLDFTQFTRTVVLPQGDFAEFLKDDAASRQRLLRRLLDLEMYSRMGSLARERAKASASQIHVLNEQIERHAEITPMMLKAATEQHQALESFADTAVEAQTELDSVEAELVELRLSVETADGQIAALAATAMPTEVAELGAKVASVADAISQAQAHRDELRKQRDAHETSAAELGDVVALRTDLSARRKLAELQAEVDQLEPAMAELGDAARYANKTLEEATADRESADETLSKTRTAADAGAWISTLVEGDPCPVCQQVVGALPDHDPSAELATAEKAAAEAAAVWKQARSTNDEVRSSLSVQRAKLEERAADLAEAKAAVDGEFSDDEVAERLQKAEQATLAGTEIAEQLKMAEVALDKVATEAASFGDLERRQRAAFGECRDAVASLNPPPPEGASLVDDWQALAAWSEARHAELADDREKIAVKGRELAEKKKALLATLEGGAAPFDLDVSQLSSSLPARRQALAVEVARLTERLDEKKTVSKQIDELDAKRQVDDMLGRQLSASGFERWLLAEALDDLVERATVRLLELSNGQFSLSTSDNSFRIIDHRNADHERDVRTLSGGETFLASLALALALSDSIADLAPVGAPRLESMFLDEGFGTLDPETLDVVAGAIEELSASGRLVGIVTHIEPLAERMPVRFAVTKGPNTSTVERQTS